VVVVGDDFTVRGGSADASISAKPLMAEDMASDFRLPIIRIIEGSGGGGSVKTIETKGASEPAGRHRRHARLLHDDREPGAGAGGGPGPGLGGRAGRGAAGGQPLLGDDPHSAMFVAGPPVVARLGQPLTKQELGGADIQTAPAPSTTCAETEEEAFEASAALPVLPAVVGARPAAGAARATTPSAPTNR
jgi:acetyl-CoA carboxylase carboxyltransferase component